MQLNKINDDTLIKNTQSLVAIERKTLREILEHLQEIYDRRLFASLGHSSLIKFMVVELKYSESSAYRRYQALKLAKEVPAAATLIEQGRLSLCNANKIQTLLKGESTDLKKLALESMQDKSTRQGEKVLFDLCPAAADRAKKREKFTAESSTNTRISVSLKNSAVEKINLLKARTKKYDTAELLEMALDIALKATDPLAMKARTSKGSEISRIIPAQTKRDVIKRAHSRCQYPGCNEIHFLEIDHKIPVCHGGKNDLNNLRLLCKAHHQLVTIEQLGKKFTLQFLKS